jgi:polar amino acid transport system substrate-binding protein
VQSRAELDDASRSYAALASSTSADFVTKHLPKAKLVATVDYKSAVQMVIDGEVDALVADFQVCQVTVMRNRGSGLTATRQPFTVEPLGIALPADAPLLLNLVQNYLDTLEYTGLLTRFKAKWLSDDAWLTELP